MPFEISDSQSAHLLERVLTKSIYLSFVELTHPTTCLVIKTA